MIDEQVVSRAMEFIAKFEGLETKAYWDVDGYAICYGNHVESINELPTADQCRERLKIMVRKVIAVVNAKFSKQNLNENQLIALVSLYYNVKNPSHVAWRIQTNQSEKSIRNIWIEYHGAGGIALNGLKKRRQAEVNLFFKP